MHFTVHTMPGERIPTPLIVAKYVHTIGIVGILILFIPFIRYDCRASCFSFARQKLVAGAVNQVHDIPKSDDVRGAYMIFALPSSDFVIDVYAKSKNKRHPGNSNQYQDAFYYAVKYVSLTQSRCLVIPEFQITRFDYMS